jgi:hypothetical protein
VVAAGRGEDRSAWRRSRSSARQARTEERVSVPVGSSTMRPGGTPRSRSSVAITALSAGPNRPLAPVGT